MKPALRTVVAFHSFSVRRRGFAWPCFGYREDTATQSRDRGTPIHRFDEAVANPFPDRHLRCQIQCSI